MFQGVPSVELLVSLSSKSCLRSSMCSKSYCLLIGIPLSFTHAQIPSVCLTSLRVSFTWGNMHMYNSLTTLLKCNMGMKSRWRDRSRLSNSMRKRGRMSLNKRSHRLRSRRRSRMRRLRRKRRRTKRRRVRAKKVRLTNKCNKKSRVNWRIWCKT